MFFILVFVVHFLVNLYIGYRGYQALEVYPNLRVWFVLFMILMVLAYPLGRILEKYWYHPIPITLHWIGAFWFAVMLYSTLLLLVIDIARVVNSIVPFFQYFNSDVLMLKWYSLIAVAGIVVVVVLAGHINAWHAKTVTLNLSVDKPAGDMKSVTIVAVSDVHMGTIIGPRKTQKLVNSINALKPDLVLLAGDVVDEDVGPVIQQNLGENLQKIIAPLGVYAVTGNHEYIGGVEPSVKYLEQNGIKMLRDSSVLISNAFYVVGREDRFKNARTQNERLSLNELLAGVDMSRPVIMLDHQPYNLDAVADAGVDVQISGHTHHGQLWPFGYITQKLFEVSRGYKQKGKTHFYVSTGFGTWGPPVRTGNRPEIVLIHLRFKN
ncbi:metallophosphoesterase [Geofilum sp. OHC36d9]|uniref:metallophosphoesterase n=1 Tax=Geofilum sp. OHC36d9 TaxID=3458413 RepID=UPI004034900B